MRYEGAPRVRRRLLREGAQEGAAGSGDARMEEVHRTGDRPRLESSLQTKKALGSEGAAKPEYEPQRGSTNDVGREMHAHVHS